MEPLATSEPAGAQAREAQIEKVREGVKKCRRVPKL